MRGPATAIENLRPDLSGSLTEFDLQADRAGFIGLRVLPVLEVGVYSSPFGKLTIEQLLQTRDTRRAPGGGYSRSNFTLGTDTFTCEEHGAEEVIDKRTAKMYANYFDAELIATERARDVVLRNYEIRAAALLGSTGTHTNAAATAALTVKASSTLIANVNTRKRAIWEATGIWPNCVILDRRAVMAFKLTDEFRDNVKYSGNSLPGAVTNEMLAEAFDVPTVLVTGSAKNTANSSQTAVIAGVWDHTQVIVTKIATSNDIEEPCAGRTFHWGADGSQIGGVIETYYDVTKRSDVVRCRMDTDEKELYTAVTEIITGVLS